MAKFLRRGTPGWIGLVVLVALLAVVAVAAGCGASEETTTTAPASTSTTAAQSNLILASTTSTQDSGLFDVLIPEFNKVYPQYTVKVVAVGSGEALRLGQNKDADVLLVHSPSAEETFMAGGYGIERKAVMYNDFIIVGPASDPAGIKGMTSAKDAFTKIASAKSTFFTRADESGTHTKELSIWKAAGITPSGSWYQATGQGMGATLTIANEKNGYTLADRGTYLSRKSTLALQVLVEGDKLLFNQYHVITVKGARNLEGANDFLTWIVSPEGQKVIADVGVEKYGQALFTPNAGQAE